MISVLFCRKDSIYKELGYDCWDIDRDARGWPGGNSIVAHPPCRAWGQLAHFANPRPGEKELAVYSIQMIRQYGGVLEHPMASKLWQYMGLPQPGKVDEYGGYSLCVNQSWWGHKAEKNTMLYVCGCKEKHLPLMPLNFDSIEYVVSSCKRNKYGRRGTGKKEIPKSMREKTPIAFAKWLIEVAELCNKNNHKQQQ